MIVLFKVSFTLGTNIFTGQIGKGEAVGYADDGLILVSGIDPNVLVSIGKKLFEKAKEHWGKEFMLNFSDHKTVCMM